MKKILKSRWGGIYPCDKIPINICKKCDIGLICNTQKMGNNGEHWIAIFLPKTGTIEYFDSFGKKPTNSFFLQFINKTRYKYNKRKVQHDMSDTCGQHCMFYLLCRNYGVSFLNFFNYYVNDHKANDKFVHLLFNPIMRKMNICINTKLKKTKKPLSNSK